MWINHNKQQLYTSTSTCNVGNDGIFFVVVVEKKITETRYIR